MKHLKYMLPLVSYLGGCGAIKPQSLRQPQHNIATEEAIAEAEANLRSAYQALSAVEDLQNNVLRLIPGSLSFGARERNAIKFARTALAEFAPLHAENNSKTGDLPNISPAQLPTQFSAESFVHKRYPELLDKATAHQDPDVWVALNMRHSNSLPELPSPQQEPANQVALRLYLAGQDKLNFWVSDVFPNAANADKTLQSLTTQTSDERRVLLHMQEISALYQKLMNTTTSTPLTALPPGEIDVFIDNDGQRRITGQDVNIGLQASTSLHFDKLDILVSNKDGWDFKEFTGGLYRLDEAGKRGEKICNLLLKSSAEAVSNPLLAFNGVQINCPLHDKIK